MKIKNEKEVFDLYVKKAKIISKTDMVLQAPFYQETDGRVWASDGHIMIMVSQDCVSAGRYEPSDIGNKLPVREYNTDTLIMLSSLQDALGRCMLSPKAKRVNCPECKGNGTVNVLYRASYDNTYYDIEGNCPICDGDGKVKTEEMEGLKLHICNAYFNSQLFEKIAKTCNLLDIDKIRLVRTSELGLNIIEISKDIHIGIAPVIPDYHDKEDAIELEV